MRCTCLTNSCRGGTLIEVLAATALLGGVLSASIVGIARFQAAQNTAKLRIQAVGIADQLLTGWLAAGSIPRSGSEEIDEAGWRWETSSRAASLLDDLETEIVTVTIFAPDRGSPITSVDVLTSSGPVNPSQAAHAAEVLP